MAGPHHHHHGGHHGGGRFRGGRDVVYMDSGPYCPPGWFIDPYGVCRPLPSLQSAAGAGDIAGNILAMSPTIEAMKTAWKAYDGREFGQAIQDAYIRAGRNLWKNDLASKNDLIVLALSSSLDARAIDDGSDIGKKASFILGNTWSVLAKKVGYQGQGAADVAKMPGAQASIELIVLIVAVIAMAGVYAFIVYKAAEIIQTKMVVDAESEELVRLHAEGQKIVDRHLANPNLPWTPEELQILQDLKDQQDGIRKQIGGHAPPPANPFDPVPFIVGGVAIVAGYLFFLHKRGT